MLFRNRTPLPTPHQSGLGGSIREYPDSGYAEEIVRDPTVTYNMGALAVRGSLDPAAQDLGAVYVQTVDRSKVGADGKPVRYQYTFNVDGLVGHQTGEAQEMDVSKMMRSRHDITVGKPWRMPVGRIPFFGRRAKGVVDAVAVPYVRGYNPPTSAPGSNPPTVRGLRAINDMLRARGKSPS